MKNNNSKTTLEREFEYLKRENAILKEMLSAVEDSKDTQGMVKQFRAALKEVSELRKSYKIALDQMRELTKSYKADMEQYIERLRGQVNLREKMNTEKRAK